MIPQQDSIVYALVCVQQRGNLLQHIARRNTIAAGCSIYYFEKWSDLLAKLLATPDERLPTLIALDVSVIRTDNIGSLSYLRNSKRLRAIPTLLLESKVRTPAAVTAIA